MTTPGQAVPPGVGPASPELASVPAFDTEYEHELERWLRRRFQTLCVTLLTLDVLLFVVMLGTGDASFVGGCP